MIPEHTEGVTGEEAIGAFMTSAAPMGGGLVLRGNRVRQPLPGDVWRDGTVMSGLEGADGDEYVVCFDDGCAISSAHLRR